MATEARIEVETRRHQMFPVLSAQDIGRIRRFGSVRR
jgi:thioredoxin reductase (NADPH)